MYSEVFRLATMSSKSSRQTRRVVRNLESQCVDVERAAMVSAGMGVVFSRAFRSMRGNAADILTADREHVRRRTLSAINGWFW
jgi:hypothetical protein